MKLQRKSTRKKHIFCCYRYGKIKMNTVVMSR